ncbi:hypothetical protein [Oceanobacillus kimchii]|uniref:hypothetical protein n=1 Tax=Oceanobacillus kimchii TaxID=746691 RepID=UPI00232CD9C2|nr:hypothetical protein [Oceanobacillus kimchii]
MELQQIVEMMIQTNKKINYLVNQLFDQGKEMANTEFKYRQALSVEIAKLESQGMKVTLIPDVAKGRIAELKLERDSAKWQYKSSVEALKALQAELNGLQTISRYQSEV